MSRGAPLDQCHAVLLQPELAGQGEVVAATSDLDKAGHPVVGCTLNFQAGDSSLTALGVVNNGCPSEASILVPVNVSRDGSYEVDQDELKALDNADCVRIDEGT